MKPKKSTEKHIKLVFEGKDPKKKPDQPNLFGEQDDAYNTIQEEITIVVDAIQGCRDIIKKKDEQLTELITRKGKLDRAAETVAKLRDGALKKKTKEEKGKASWPAEEKKKEQTETEPEEEPRPGKTVNCESQIVNVLNEVTLRRPHPILKDRKEEPSAMSRIAKDIEKEQKEDRKRKKT